jgi:hypothetical protein
MTSLGGTTYAWGSPQIVTLAVAGVVLLALFVAVERRAEEPILPLRLFKNRVFAVSSALGFVVGFAMFGAITFLPVYLQIVKGVDPTVAGLRLLPLMAGLLLTSVGSGQLISRTGHYKIFPIIGTALMTIGLLLLSRLGPDTSWLDVSLYMFVFGMGLGSVMQVTVIATQNAVDYKDLGAATSGVTYFRSMGGSFGTTIFGLDLLQPPEREHRALPRRGGAAGRRQQRDAEPRRAEPALPRRPTTPSSMRTPTPSRPSSWSRRRSPPSPFLISWLLPELKLRKTLAAGDPGPDVRHADRPQLRAGARTRPRSARWARGPGDALPPHRRPGRLERPAPGRHLPPRPHRRPPRRHARGLGRADRHLHREPRTQPRPTGPPRARVDRTGQPRDQPDPEGRSALERLGRAREDGLRELLDDWSPAQEAELDERLKTLARDCIDQDAARLRHDEDLREAA